VGALAAGLASASEFLLQTINAGVHAIIRAGNNSNRAVAAAALAHAAWSASLAGAAAGLVAAAAPLAAGGGVSLVMAHLNGSSLPGLLDAKTLAVKFVGTVLGVAANVGLGAEAPMIHLGAATADACARGAGAAWDAAGAAVNGVSRVSGRGRGGSSDSLLAPPPPRRRILASDADRREFVSAGVAAGLAAAFGAPVGGVLFGMEEACTHWSRKVESGGVGVGVASAADRLYRCADPSSLSPSPSLLLSPQVAMRSLAAGTVAVATVSQLYPRSLSGLLGFRGVSPLTALQWAHQLPLIAAVAAGGGLLGAGYQVAHRALARSRGPGAGATPAARARRAAVTAALVVLSMFALSATAGRCVDVPEWQAKGFGFALNCGGGTYNDLASAFFAPPVDTIRHIFSLGELSPRFDVCSGTSCYFTLRSLALLVPAYVAAMVAVSATAVPGGLFTPAILAGGAAGGTAGLLLAAALPGWEIQPGLYAMVGATAALGGVFRASVALVVVVVEGTRSVEFLLGIAVAAIAANWVGDLLLPGGVYESDADADGRVVFLRPTPPAGLAGRTAGDVCARGVVCLGEVEGVGVVAAVLERAAHGSFPVVVAAAAAADAAIDGALLDAVIIPLPSRRQGTLAGLVPRRHIVAALAAGAWCDAGGTPLPGAPTTADDVAARLAACGGRGGGGAGAKAAARAAAARAPRAAFLDLRPLMDPAPVTVRPDCPASRAHALFVSLGLRCLPVTEPRGAVVGVVTRSTLDAAAGDGPWRRSRPAPPPAAPPAARAWGGGELGRRLMFVAAGAGSGAWRAGSAGAGLGSV